MPGPNPKAPAAQPEAVQAFAFHEDIPAETPGFDADMVAASLAPVLMRRTKGAVVLGIHGPWGSGKTTLMQSIRRQVKTLSDEAPGVASPLLIDFVAWKYQDKEALWRALILHILAVLRAEAKRTGAETAEIDELQDRLYRSFQVEEAGDWKVNWQTLIVEVVRLALSVMKLDFMAGPIRESMGWFGRLFLGKPKEDAEEAPVVDAERVEKLAGVLERTVIERHAERVRSIEQFLDEYRDLVGGFSRDDKRLFVFIDDLDRCLPESALEVFEAIKLFLDAPACSYVVALDRDVIRKGLAVKYARRGEAAGGQSLIDADEYIEKTISISYDIPRLSLDDVKGMIGLFALPVTLNEEQKDLIAAGLGHNPRRIKRFMNTLSTQLHLGTLVKARPQAPPEWLFDAEDLRFGQYLKLALIAYRYPEVAAELAADPELAVRLQQANERYQRVLRDKGITAARAEREDQLCHELDVVQRLAEKELFWRLMHQAPLLPKDGKAIEGLVGWFRASPAADQDEA